MIDRLALSATGLKSRESSHAGVVMNSSQNLIARARTGDREAFGLLFERHARPVLAFLYNLLGRRDMAEELTQETFVRAYRGLPEFRDEAKFSTWLFGIAKNVAREWIRSAEGWRQSSSCDVTSVSGQGDFSSPADELLGKELNAAMVIALRSLNGDRRAVFVLKVFHHHSYQEIVEVTGFSLAKVKTELHRARAEMRQRMRPYLETK
jgi:RNA polymerase sigma-70 factor, ECF subfamily